MTDLNLDKIFCGDCNEVLKDIPSNSVDLVITSPPYFQQREYGGGNGVGNEKKVEGNYSPAISNSNKSLKIALI